MTVWMLTKVCESGIIILYTVCADSTLRSCTRRERWQVIEHGKHQTEAAAYFGDPAKGIVQKQAADHTADM